MDLNVRFLESSRSIPVRVERTERVEADAELIATAEIAPDADQMEVLLYAVDKPVPAIQSLTPRTLRPYGKRASDGSIPLPTPYPIQATADDTLCQIPLTSLYSRFLNSTGPRGMFVT